MRILILGGGQVGASVAENLVSEGNDVTIVDQDSDLLKLLQDKLDIRTVPGNAAHPSVLQDAGIGEAEMLLALTRNDETNLVACALAEQRYNVPTRIARLRATGYVDGDMPVMRQFGVEHAICPEQIVTDNLLRVLAYPRALQVLDFAGGKVQLVVARAVAGGKLLGKPLRQLREDMPEADCRICAIYRKDKLVRPDGDTVIEADDEVFFIAARPDVAAMLNELRASEKPVRRVMIAGGGNIGYRLARMLSAKYEVKLIEHGSQRARWLAENLPKALVLHGEATDEGLLESENIDEMDVFCALTNDDEDNLMSTLLAKRMGARRVIALVNRSSYVDLLEGNRIDIVISPYLSTIGSILAHLRRGDVVAAQPVRRGAAEVMEVVIHGDGKTSSLVGCRLDAIDLPDGCSISAVIRGQQVLMAHHDLQLQAEDHVIFFVHGRHKVRQIEKLTQVKLGFF
ncbi:Trk system potassium transporter TrkA [Vogesella fluminis]|uniref:Trk system potassium uptake protein TrkA n=1 Tax=Vogesella fluminis TaxID=1069161 RepID=A0ABQ3H6X1_9NEIS|nr:Trk system potassium transporter TrkA [Vogesella fluminis]GHD71403.1 Trk system potassium transport protein TrkA [Vogesella fluminis]